MRHALRALARELRATSCLEAVAAAEVDRIPYRPALRLCMRRWPRWLARLEYTEAERRSLDREPRP